MAYFLAEVFDWHYVDLNKETLALYTIILNISHVLSLLHVTLNMTHIEDNCVLKYQ